MTGLSRAELTEHQLLVLERIAAGRTHAEIAAELVLTPKGLTAAVNRAMAKLGARNAPHAVLLACRAGLLDGRPFLRHGDHAGYETHRKRRIPICDDCRAGEKAYRDGLKAAREAT
ncbi:LuxR C-terminal-related transcriptional regulator [Streptomyces sp. NPDC090077]|uniref:LuxR C-terminal-related transcriptional regulator n=1 Tax=Streptomyces sp. NPDC090077 TaxID=3365938 RepID=UPI00380A062D